MRFSAISEFVFSCQRSERYCLLIALIVRRSGEIICKDWPSRRPRFAHGVRGIPGPQRRGIGGTQIFWSDLSCPPAHRDNTAMNGAHLLTDHCDSADRATCLRFRLLLG